MTEDFKERLARLEAKHEASAPPPPTGGYATRGGNGPRGPRRGGSLKIILTLLATVMLPTAIALGVLAFKQSTVGQELTESYRTDGPAMVFERVSLGAATGVWTSEQAEERMREQMGDRLFEGYMAQAQKLNQSQAGQ